MRSTDGISVEEVGGEKKVVAGLFTALLGAKPPINVGQALRKR